MNRPQKSNTAYCILYLGVTAAFPCSKSGELCFVLDGNLKREIHECLFSPAFVVAVG